MKNTDRYVVISTDTHCGSDLLGYKPYLEKRYHEDFDAWAATYSDAWVELGEGTGEHQVGVASVADELNWESEKRQKALEAEGVVAEVLFPNTTPPFYPSGAITAAAPGYPPIDRQEYEMRLAGIRAHNRWAADFARQLPGRRAPIAQVFLSDVDDTLAEIQRAYDDGAKGVLLPPDHFTQLQSLYYPRYDPIWALCADLGIPVVRHGVQPSEAASPETGLASAAVGVVEATHFAERALIAMILSGVFERHPSLKFVMTELGCAWVTRVLGLLEGFCADASVPGTISRMFAGDAVSALSKKPTEYFADNCYLGSFFSPADMASRNEVGVGKMMWGADFPHIEGTAPYTRLAWRSNFADLSVEDTRRMLGGTAAEVYGFDLDALQPIANEVGPTVDELHVPLTAEEAPSYPDESVCPSFAGFTLIETD
ncbi:amidohydrolase family protein [Nocardia nova]|uniref:Amidohydrolase n=1 Tax=Nocardia nova SH22a TaxID=1415166 RepID=W5TGF6_9NOCA|nr:amidohydrolase family protein [Nocardia nova]AHH18410.1 amidohydrolase [Nocardia nova SH22a]